MVFNAFPQPNTFQPNTLQPNATSEVLSPALNASSFINQPVHFPFRKLQIKRRQLSDGLYESSWVDITEFVEKWGTLRTAVDDVRLNKFTHEGITLNLKNDHAEFNPEWNGASLFFGFLTRYRTMFRIQAGYTDGSGNQFPADPTQGIFILSNESEIKPIKNTVSFKCKSIISPFQEIRADEVDGITSSMTSSEIMAKIRDATDGAGLGLFSQFITTTSWNINSTTNIITELGTTTALAEFSTWGLMEKLAEIEGFVVYITRTGGLTFKNRDPSQENSQFDLIGPNFSRPNIIKLNSFKEATDKLFTHIRFKYLNEDTETSFITAGTQTTIDARSIEWKYGRRTLELSNKFFINTGTATQIASSLVNKFSNLRSEINLSCLFMPQLEILDRVSLSYRDTSINSIEQWGRRDWAADTTTSDTAEAMTWASETSGAIDFGNKQMKILSRETNLDKFTTRLQLREVEN